ncbi:hypothetical protein RclHR1_35710001 [Rhizophagus clarus]|uniref:Uncharacterized protein n=1 Tax=Rhizophagus clarus TaxID=94130 RepID=A0A2Z6S644_9GLOM|nr:hypothetical protein RclHR1_35710001 [Rhizophagus clarus]
MFHSDYKHITDRLPDSLVKRAYQEVYENSLNRKHKSMAQTKLLRPRSWPECNVSPALPTIHVVDSGSQTNDTTWPEALKHDYEKENNCRVMNELKVLSQHLVDYNKRTFGKFMEDIEKDYREQVTTNKKMRYEIKNLKMQLLEVEKELASMKSNSSH